MKIKQDYAYLANKLDRRREIKIENYERGVKHNVWQSLFLSVISIVIVIGVMAIAIVGFAL
jgi:hypothetical protein